VSDQEKKCEERIDEELTGRVKELKRILKMKDEERASQEIENISLSFGEDPLYRAMKWELSYGGPADGFMFFENGTIQYYYQDWFDGAVRDLTSQDYKVLREIWYRFFDGMLEETEKYEF